jgi:hypothetical protein
MTIRLIALEILKVRRGWRGLLLLGLLAMAPLVYTFLTPIALVSKRAAPILIASLPAVLTLAHLANAYVMWPLALLVFVSEMWSQEVAARTLRSLVLTQVGRRQVLVAKVAVALAFALASWLVFALLSFIDFAILLAAVDAQMPGLTKHLQIDKVGIWHLVQGLDDYA